MVGVAAGHDCLECLEYRQHYWTETHGLDCGPYENGWDEWFECAICGKEFTAKELDFAVENGGNRIVKREPDVCKSYTIHVRNGRLTLSETPSRLAIEVTIYEETKAVVYLNKTQFQMLCNLDSNYDGLEIINKPEPEPEPEQADRDAIPA